MNKAQSRSPYIVTHTDTNLTSIKVELFFYTGTRITSRPAGATFTLQVEALNEVCTFDIAEFADDFIELTFDGTYGNDTTQMIFCDYRITEYISEIAQTPLSYISRDFYSGYSRFEYGAQNSSAAERIDNKFLLSSNYIYVPSDEIPNIPVYMVATRDVKYFEYINDVLTETSTESISASTTSANRFRYCTVPSTDIVRVKMDGKDEEVWIKHLPCTKFNSYKVTFINSFGVKQDMWFTGKSSESTKATTIDKYKKNTLIADDYSTATHRNTFLHKNGVRSIDLSTAFMDESQNIYFEELLLSRQVWITYDSQVLPINITTSDIKYRTSVNDKTVSYNISADFAYDTINNIR